MPPSLSSTPAFVTALLLLLTFFTGDVTSSPCDRAFTCGSLRNITYPFTGGERPDQCGPPQFRLACRGNYTEFTANSVTYRVLEIDQRAKILTLARSDLWRNTCSQTFVNSTFDSAIFDASVGNLNLTLIYGCTPPSPIPYRLNNLFSCNVSGANGTDAFYLFGPVPSDPNLRFATCYASFAVPMLVGTLRRLYGNQTTLENALMEGFNVNYSDPYYKQCSDCIESGRQCGFDSNLGQPVCICGNKPCPVTGNSGGRRNMSRTIGFSIAGAAIFAIGLGWCCIAWRLRKKTIAFRSAQKKSRDLPISSSSKELITPHSSKGITTTPPSTNSSQSVPSYPSLSFKYDPETLSTYFGVQVFSYAELEEATGNFDPSRELGNGGFGIVYHGKLNDGREVAVKLLYENNFKRLEQFMNEVEILTHLQHRNLVALYGCTSKRSRELLLVYEYIPNGTLADHLHGQRSNSGSLSWPIRLSIAIETADALAYLHASDIIHRDVKTSNIFLDNNFCVKVGDFGLSRSFPTDVTHVSTAPQGTPGYVDPEYYQCYQLTSKSDVYSFGVVLAELISSKQAVDINRQRHDINLSNMAVNMIQNHALHELVDPCLGFETDGSVRRMTTLVAELAFRCLQQNRDLRPSMEEVLKILRGVKNEELNAQKAEVIDIVEVEDGVSL